MTTKNNSVPNYLPDKMQEETSGQMLTRLGMDGYEWAKEFTKHFPSVSLDDALCWFCNAIMAGYDKGKLDGAKAERERIWDEISEQPQFTPDNQRFPFGFVVTLKRIIFGEVDLSTNTTGK